VVLVGEHGEEGALGVILNRTSESTVDEAVPELAALVEGSAPIHVGGPVQPSAIVVLAEFVEPERAETLVLEDIGFLPSEIDPDELGELRRARVFAGYAGWGPGQLDDELREGSWIVEPADPEDVFTADPGELWSEVLRRKGGPFGVLALMPPDPSLN
jgi:putative transcriptional regulator